MTEQFTAMVLDYAIKIAALILMGLFFSLWQVAKSFIETKGLAEKAAYFKSAAETVVRALEQEGLIQQYDGALKKEIATLALMQIRDKLGWTFISNVMIDNFIEEMVQIINTEAGKFEDPPFIELDEVISDAIGQATLEQTMT